MYNDNKILIAVDNSYFMYFCIFSAEYQFRSKYADDAAIWIRPADEVDQQNLPDLTNNNNFRRLLKTVVMKKLEVLDWILKQNFQDELDYADQIDTVFCVDDKLTHSFRKDLYPEYKSNRTLVKRQYDVKKIKDYIMNVIYKELQLEEKYGYNFIFANGAEADDCIAMTLSKLPGYSLKILFASDHDFLQLKDVHQFDLKGNEVKRIIAGEELSPEDYLLHKIIVGDKSDGIQQVFQRVGDKKALAMIKDQELLKIKLKESQDAINQFQLNKKLISFDQIPEELQKSICENINQQMFKLTTINNDHNEFEGLMEL